MTLIIRVFVALSMTLALVLGGCATSMSDVKNKAHESGCESGCDETRDKCISKCAEEVDKDACELGCKEARDKCMKDCK